MANPYTLEKATAATRKRRRKREKAGRLLVYQTDKNKG